VRRLDIGHSLAARPPAPAPSSTSPAAASSPHGLPTATHHSETGTTGAAPFDAALLVRCEKALARHVGPLARALTRRAANDSANVAELVAKLAAQIDGERDRQAFIAAMQ
jgi:eukaryotic-like serine/threonine-protein kinase